MDPTGQSLIIDKIVLNNFKLFFGKNEIILGYSPEKYVNLIIGPGGSGKTTIANALHWAFNNTDPDTSNQDLFILNRQSIRPLKNGQKTEVFVQIFLSDKNSDKKIMVDRKCKYINHNDSLSLVSDKHTVKEFKKSRWISSTKNVPNKAFQLFFWNGKENPTDLIKNILPILSHFSNIPDKKLKKMITASVLTGIKETNHKNKFVIEFDKNGIFQLKHNNCDFLPSLSSGELIVIWFSLMAVIRKTTIGNLPFILDGPFSYLDTMKRIRIVESLKDNFSECQLILIGTNSEFEPIMEILKPITNCEYHLELN